jgi:serine/threonine-protein kinase
MAERLWNDGDLDACREYIEANLGNVAEFQADSEARRAFGDIYYILGNCYYYQPGDPNYETARWNFELADRLARDNPTYCRDYAIALARTGAVEDAESALARARRLGLEEGSLSLLEGEIGFARREYESAAERLALAVELAADDYTRYRACHTSDEIFRLLGQPERSIRLLAAEMGRMPLSRRPEMAERLADAYVRAGDYASATELFGELSESGAPQFHIMQNMAVLLQNGGDLDGAAAMLERMADLFPNDYRVPMRQAYLEAERQAGIENESRDYAAAKRGYDEAARLYGGSARPGEADPEMQQLEGLMEQLRNSGWID